MSTHSEQIEIGIAVGFGICSILLAIICVVHIYRAYQDLYTTERKSVYHRRQKPKVNTLYKYIAYLTILSVLFYFVASISATVSSIIASTSFLCQLSSTIGLWSFHLSKIFMYCTFLERLHVIYKQSDYGYSKRFLSAIMIILCLSFGTIIVLEGIVLIGFQIVKKPFNLDNDKSFPYYCDWDIPDYIVGGFGMIDIIMSILNLILFIIPLKKTINSIKKNYSNQDLEHFEKVCKKMVFIGMKVFIITAVASITSLIFIFMIIIWDIPVFAGIDYVINSICLIMMSAYYDDDIYYKRICYFCILCCDPKGYSTRKYKSNKKITKLKLAEKEKYESGRDEMGGQSVTSADTMSQLRKLNENQHSIKSYASNPGGSVNNNNNNDDNTPPPDTNINGRTTTNNNNNNNNNKEEEEAQYTELQKILTTQEKQKSMSSVDSEVP